MTTLELEIALSNHFDIRRNVIVNNITNMSTIFNFEVDMAILSKSNYCTAIELKISKNDLRNDLKKSHIKNAGNGKNHFFKH